MRIAMVASEAAPIVKTGGLGDVMQALPLELSRLRGNEIVMFLPYYKRIKENKQKSKNFKQFLISFGGDLTVLPFFYILMAGLLAFGYANFR